MKKQEFIDKINAVLPRGLKVETIENCALIIKIWFTPKKPVNFCDENKYIIEKTPKLTVCKRAVTLYSVRNLKHAISIINKNNDRLLQFVKISHTAALKEVRAYKAHLKTKKGQRERAQKLVANIISDHEKYVKAFFWSPAGSASQRRSNEWNRDCEFNFGGAQYHVTQDYSESCRNCYYNCDIIVNGVKKDIRALKNLAEVL